MAFLDLSFPPSIAAGATGGPTRKVDIVALSSGAEERNARWKDSRRSWQVGLALRNLDDLAAVVGLFEEAGGPLHSFRFRDWSDFWSGPSSAAAPAANDQRIGTGDGAATEFQLVKRYGALLHWQREITKPVAGSVRVSVSGAEVATGWSVDNLTGLVTFLSPPASGAAIRAGFRFDVPVRFASETLQVDLSCFDAAAGIGLAAAPDIQLIEVRE